MTVIRPVLVRSATYADVTQRYLFQSYICCKSHAAQRALEILTTNSNVIACGSWVSLVNTWGWQAWLAQRERDSIWPLTHWFIYLKYHASSLMPPFMPPQTTAWGAILRVGINFCSLTLGEAKPLHRRLEIHCPALHQLVYTPKVFNYSKKFGRIETLGKKQCNP